MRRLPLTFYLNRIIDSMPVPHRSVSGSGSDAWDGSGVAAERSTDRSVPARERLGPDPHPAGRT